MTTHEIKADLYNSYWTNDLTEDLRAALEESFLDSEKGKIIGHENAMKRVKIRYNLF